MKKPTITSISVTGLKSRDSETNLGGLNLFLGPVGSGKTTILDALRFAALGHVPALGKSESNSGRLMRAGSAIDIKVELDDGRRFERGLCRVGKSLKGSAFASWAPPKSKLGETAELVRSLFGASDGEAAQALDLRELLNATAPERARQITELLDASAIDPAELAARGHALVLLRLAGVKVDAMPTDLNELARLAATIGPMIKAQAGPGHEAAGIEIAGALALLLEGEGLTKSEARANEEKLIAGREMNRRTAARAQLEDKLGQVESGPAEDADALQGARDAAVADEAAAVKEIEVAERANAVKLEVESKGPALRDAIEAAETVHQAATEEAKRAPGLVAKAEALQDPPAPPAPEIVVADPDALAAATRLEGEADEKTKAAESLKIDNGPYLSLEVKIDETLTAADAVKPELLPLDNEALDVARRAASDGKAAAGAASLAVISAQLNPWRRVEDVVTILTERGIEADALFGELVSLAKEHGGNVAELKQEAERAEETRLGTIETQNEIEAKVDVNSRANAIYERAATTKREALRAEAAALRAEAKVARATAERVVLERRTEIRTKCLELRREAADARDTATREAERVNLDRRTEYTAAVEAQVAGCAKNADGRRGWQLEAAGLIKAAETARLELERSKARLAELEAKLSGIDELGLDIEALRSRQTCKATAIADLDRKLESARGAAALRRELVEILSSIERATALRDAHAAAEWSCQRLREIDLAARSGGLQELMKRFLVAAGREEEPFLRASRGATEFGWRLPDGSEITVEALSGGESCLFTTALAAAVIVLREPELRVLLVEAAELGAGETADALLRGCEAVAGDLSLVCVATTAGVEPRPDWNVVNLADEVSS